MTARSRKTALAAACVLGLLAPGCSQPTVVELDIAEGSYFASPEGRGLLKYLVRCALKPGTEARLELPGEKVSYQGGLGLAPAWAERALTTTEQRWVSACMYALTNKFGTSVLVNMRGAHPAFGEDKEEEIRQNPLHEGAFFGNIFAAQPVAYVCEGAGRAKMLDHPIGALRRCAQPSGAVTADGRAITECGFVVTGPCSAPSSFVVGGERWDEAVNVWLPPEPQKN